MADLTGRPAIVPKPPLLVGREGEMETLRNALAGARGGRGSLVLIGGEAGIGKTALAEALLAEAADWGALALVGRCYDLSETPPYGPWIDLIGQLHTSNAAPALPAAFATPGTVSAVNSQAVHFQQVRGFLREAGGRRPLVLLLDDLHWADPASLDLLRFIGREIATSSLLVLAAYRADGLTISHPLYQLLPTLVREARAARLDLRPLDDVGLRALARGYHALPPPDEDRLVAYLRARAEGNPFYAGELLRALAEGRTLRPGQLGDLAGAQVPSLLRQVIDVRVAHLGDGARGPLEVAAVIGQTVPMALWAAVAEVAEATMLPVVEAAAAARLLTVADDGDRATFAHALIREALYEAIPPTRRRAWHRRVAAALVDTPGADPDAVAYHFRRAGDPRAAAWLVTAGERAQRAAATLTAAERYETALALMERSGAPPGARGWLLLRSARLRRWAEPPRTVAMLAEAERLGAAAGDRLLAAAAHFWRGESRSYAGEFRRGLGELAAGLAALEALPPAELARLGPLVAAGVVGAGVSGGTLAAGLALAGRFAELRALDTRLAAGTPLTAAAGRATQNLHALAIAEAADGRPEAAHALWARARADFRSDGNEVMAGSIVLHELSWCALPYRADQVAARRRLAAEGERAWERAAGAQGRVAARAVRLPELVLDGAWAEARAFGDAALAHGVVATRRDLHAAQVGSLARAQGHAARAWALIHACLPQGPATDPGDSVYLAALALQRLAADLALDAAELPLAHHWLEAHDRWLAWGGAVLGRAEGALGWAAYHRAAGDAPAACRDAGRALALASAPRQPLALLAAHRLLGELGTTARQHAEATDHLDAALALAEACAAPYERALTLLALAELRAARGDPPGAGAALAEARAICGELEARPALDRCDALAATCGASAPPQPRARPASPTATPPVRLTPREAEVLRLVAAGQSNRAMAETLCRSERTVERHIESLYRKIGARNRADATAFALRHGLA